MATREYDLGIGNDLIDATGPTWQISGIQIDNPSGSWLFVTGINVYVPPFTNGWAYPVQPSQASISVKFVDSPSGSISNPIGGNPHVVISDQDMGQSGGMPSGALAQTATSGQEYFRASTLMTAAELGAGSTQTLFTVPALRRMQVTNLSISAAMDGTGLTTDAELRSLVMVDIMEQGGGNPATILTHAAISPETPFCNLPLTPGTVTVQELYDLKVRAFTVPNGGGQQMVYVDVVYYLERLS